MTRRNRDYAGEALAAGNQVVDMKKKLDSFLNQQQTPTPSNLSSLPVEGLDSAAFHKQLNKLLAAAGGKLSIKSGTRTHERQQQLWDQAIKKYGDPAIARKWVAPPGTSNHEKGLAADLGFADPATIKWAHDNAANFGLMFPLANENWHVELLRKR